MSGGSKNQTVTNKTDIPAFLQPYMQNQAAMSNDALTGLQGMLSGAGADQLVAPFNATQQQGQQMAIDAATNPNGPVQAATGVLQSAAQGGYINQMLPQLNQGIAAGMNAQIDPGILSQFANEKFQLDPTSQAALQGSAAGNGLYGSAGFDEAVQASIRAARPSILSGYAQGGSGAIKGGLAQIGMQQAASDSFARLYGDERNRQLQSASQLGNFDLSGRGQQIDAAGQIYSGNIQQQQMRNQMTLGLGGILSDERTRQLQSAQALPGIGLLGSDVMRDVGGEQQQLQQQQLTAPINAQQMLIAALGGAPNFQSLMGSSSSQPIYRNRAGGALGGAATGAAIGSAFPVIGTGIGAVAGGLLGAFSG